MKVIVTAKELQSEYCVWEQACELLGINVYAIAEGLMSEDEEFTLTEEQAKELYIIK